MVRRCLGRHGDALGLCPADEIDRSGRGNVENVDLRADVLGQKHVAGDDRLLGDRRPAGQPELGRDVALVHLRPFRQPRILGVLGDDSVEGLRVFERPAHEHGVGNAFSVVGEVADLGVRGGHGPELGQVLALQPGGNGAHGAHVHVSGDLSKAHDLFDDAGRILDGRRVGHGVDAGVAARGRGLRTGQDGLGVLQAGFAQMRVRIHEPGQNDEAGGVHDRRVRRGNLVARHRGDHAVEHVDVHDVFAQQPRALENVLAHAEISSPCARRR